MGLISNIYSGAKQLAKTVYNAVPTKTSVGSFLYENLNPEALNKTGLVKSDKSGNTFVEPTLLIGAAAAPRAVVSSINKSIATSVAKGASSSIDDILRTISQGAKQSTVAGTPKAPSLVSKVVTAARPVLQTASKILTTPTTTQALIAGGIIGAGALTANSIMGNTRNATTGNAPSISINQSATGKSGGGFSADTSGVNMNAIADTASGLSYQDIMQRARASSPYGEAGQAGASSGQSFGSAGTGSEGTIATGGRSSFTGTLGAAGVGTSAIPNANPNLVTDESTPAGSRILGGTSNVDGLLPAGTDLSTPIKLNTGETVKLGDINKAMQDVKVLFDKFGDQTTSLPEYRDRMKLLMSAGMENVTKAIKAPPTPVVETQAQMDYLLQAPETERVSLQTMMDNARVQLGLPELEKQRISTMQQLQVVKEVYQKAIDDIKSNPDLPKGLAARRLTQIGEDQKFTVQQLLGNLEVLETQIDDANKSLNQSLQIFEAEEERQARQQARMQDNLKFIIESGAISALSDAELESWSDATGYDTKALQSIRSQSQQPTINPYFVENTDNNGNVTISVIDKNNPQNGVISQTSLGSVAKSTTKQAGTGGTATSDKKLSVLDVQRLNEAFQGVGIVYGDTETMAANKIHYAQEQADLQATIQDGVTDPLQLKQLFPGIPQEEIVRAVSSYSSSQKKSSSTGSLLNSAARAVKSGVDSAVGAFYNTLFR